MKRTSKLLACTHQYVFRAIDAHGQVIDVFVSPTRDTEAATTFLRRAVAETGVRPSTVTTDKAAIYPPALALVLPEAAHIAGKVEQQGIERDHGHLKGRYRCMRGFKQGRCAQVVCAGHGFMRNLCDGFYRLGCVWYGVGMPHPPRLLTAWDDLTGSSAWHNGPVRSADRGGVHLQIAYPSGTQQNRPRCHPPQLAKTKGVAGQS